MTETKFSFKRSWEAQGFINAVSEEATRAFLGHAPKTWAKKVELTPVEQVKAVLGVKPIEVKVYNSNAWVAHIANINNAIKE